MRTKFAGLMLVGSLLFVGGQTMAAEGKIIDNVKKSCNKELTTFCKGVKPGEGRILACLYAFEDRVSDQCVYALYNASVDLEKAVVALKYVAESCHADLEKNCAHVELGKGKGLECLNKNAATVSQACKDAMKETGLTKETAPTKK